MDVDPVVAEMMRLLDLGYGGRSALSRAVGVTSASVSQWAKGQSRPEPDKWSAIEKYFELDEGHFERLAKVRVLRSTPPADDQIARLQEQVLALATDLDQLTEVVRTQGAELARLRKRRGRDGD